MYSTNTKSISHFPNTENHTKKIGMVKYQQLPGNPLLPYGLWGLECALPGLGTLLSGDVGPGLRWGCPPLVKPPAE